MCQWVLVRCRVFVLMMAGIGLSLNAVSDAHAKPRTAKNSVYLELAGNAGFYSLNYERFLLDDLSARVGFSYFSIGIDSQSAGTQASASATWILLPLMVNYLGIGGDNHSLEIGAGIVPLFFGGEAKADSAGISADGSTVFFTGSVGYRYAPRDGGFNFRAAFTPLISTIGDETFFLPWLGLSFGYNF